MTFLMLLPGFWKVVLALPTILCFGLPVIPAFFHAAQPCLSGLCGWLNTKDSFIYFISPENWTVMGSIQYT